MYGFHAQVKASFDEAVKRVTEALKTEGFDARHPWRAPFRGALKRAQFRSRRNCVVVREEADGKITVGFMDPIAVLRLTDNPDIGKLAGGRCAPSSSACVTGSPAAEAEAAVRAFFASLSLLGRCRRMQSGSSGLCAARRIFLIFMSLAPSYPSAVAAALARFDLCQCGCLRVYV